MPALLFYVGVYIYPLLLLLSWSFFDPGFTLKHYQELFGESAYFRALLNTLEISFSVTILSLLIGYPLAYLMTTTSARARGVLMSLILIPLWTSLLVRTFAWIVILGRNGIVNKLLIGVGLIDQPLKLLYNMLGVQIGMVHVLLPFMVFPLYGVMSRIDPGLVRAARSLGAAPRMAFRHVFLPLSLPGVAAGCVLVFLLAVGFYITPALLGGPGQITLATLIAMMINALLNWGFGATLSLLLVTVVAALFVVFSTLMGLDRLVGAGGRR
jgi:putative spermidine/putrescine transport system permease protein